MTPLLQQVDLICATLNSTESMIANEIKFTQQSSDNNISSIIAMRGNDSVKFVNINVSVLDLPDEIVRAIVSTLLKWGVGQTITSINISDLLVTHAITWIFDNAKDVTGQMTKRAKGRIIKCLREAVDKNPGNRNYIFQGLSLWLTYNFKTVLYKDKHFPTHYVTYQYWNNKKRCTEDKDISLWSLANFQGFEKSHNVPDKVNTEDRSYKSILLPFSKANNVEPFSVLYMVMLTLKYGPPKYIVEQTMIKTKASKSVLEGLDASSLFESWE